MSVPVIPGLAGFSLTPGTATADTAIVALIQPYPGLLYSYQNARPNWYGNQFINLTSLIYTTPNEAHTLAIMRPLNWCLFSAAVAKNSTVISIDKDPGVYSTSYRYDLPNSKAAPCLAADNAIAAGDYVCYQMADGVWQLDKIASGTFGASLTLTTGTPNRTGATIAANSPLFFFGVLTDVNPDTGLAHLQSLTTTANMVDQTGGVQGIGIPVLTGGDPMMVYSSNVTTAGSMNLVAGHYRKF